MKQKILIGLFILFIGGFGILSLFDKSEISYTERRKLQRFPSIREKGRWNDDFFAELDDYFSDHFLFRDDLRKVKASVVHDVFHMLDDDGIYIEDGMIFEMEEKVDLKSVGHFKEIIEKVKKEYFEDQDCYFMMVPRKNHYLTGNTHPEYRFEDLRDTVMEDFSLTPIVVEDVLSLDAYYHTDIHWRQEKLFPVVDRFFEVTGLTQNDVEYSQKDFEPFYGSLYAKAAVSMEGDRLSYLESVTFDEISLFSLEKGGNVTVYDEKMLTSLDPYSVYLDGPTAYLEIENPGAPNNQKLIVFRDSFGSGLIPLLIPSFSKIQVVDLRYYQTPFLKDLDFEKEATVLFLYGSEVINQSGSLR